MIAAAFASTLDGVDASDVTVVVEPYNSVRVIVSIKVADAKEAAEVTVALTSVLAGETDTSVSDGMLTAAGITFTEITTQPYTYVIVESPTPPPPTPPTPTPPRTPPPAADGSAVLGIVGAAVGGLVFLVLVITIPIVVVCCCCMKKKEVAPSA